jgi:predicted HAD superfamily Cof-like phosphohydrolase
VFEFHDAYDLPVLTIPTIPDRDRIILRAKLILEEAEEVAKALESGIMVDIAKEFADLQYVLSGGILELGMQHVIMEVFDEVHKSNMSKLGDDGQPVRREDGKVMKGPNYKPSSRSNKGNRFGGL